MGGAREAQRAGCPVPVLDSALSGMNLLCDLEQVATPLWDLWFFVCEIRKLVPKVPFFSDS